MLHLQYVIAKTINENLLWNKTLLIVNKSHLWLTALAVYSPIEKIVDAKEKFFIEAF